MGRQDLLIIIIVEILLLFTTVFSEGIQCSGYCTKDPEMCKSRGGKIIGFCSNTLSCCDPLISSMATCGEMKLGPSVHFKSPNYPKFYSGDLNCEVKVKLNNDSMGIRIDFKLAEMDGQSYLESEDEPGSCESDMIFLRGFGSWGPPPRCGNLSGYSFLIEKDTIEAKNLKVLTILALMSSPAYRWHIRILQLSRRKHSSGESEKNSLDYEMPFKEKRSLLTPNTNPKEVAVTDDNTLSFDEPEPWQIPMILNGEDAIISLVPWQASLRLKSEAIIPTPEDLNYSKLKDIKKNETIEEKPSNCSRSEGFHFCGGAIIGSRYILSAAHCFYGTSKTDGMLNISSIKVVVGDTNICTDDSANSKGRNSLSSYDYDVESITLHYAFDNQLIIHDLALIRLKTKIKMLDHIKPIRMAKTGDNFVGKDALLSGWGDVEASILSNSSGFDEPILTESSSSTSPDILQASMKFVVQNETYCNEKDSEQYSAPQKQVIKHPKYASIFNSTLCTASKEDLNETDHVEVSAGRGDSGGPLVVIDGDEEGTPILIGVVSYGVPLIEEDDPDSSSISCKSEQRSIDYFASVAFYRHWIDLTISSYDNILLHNM